MPEANFAPHPENLEANYDIARLMAEAHRDFLEYGDPSLQNPTVPAFSSEMKDSWARARADDIQFRAHEGINWIFEDATYGPPDPADPDYAENFEMAMTMVRGVVNDPKILNRNQLRLINAGIKTGEKKPKAEPYEESISTEPEHAVSRVRSSMGSARRQHQEVPSDTSELQSQSAFEAMQPMPGAVRVWANRSGTVELRQASTGAHEDGIAYNETTGTVAVTDGMGGVGSKGPAKSNFGYALANAITELPRISLLQTEETVSEVIERTKQILSGMGISVEPYGRRGMSGSAGKFCELAAAVAAAQPVEGSEDEWDIVTFGDASAIIMDEHGIVEGHGEAFQLIEQNQFTVDSSREYELGDTYNVRARDDIQADEVVLASYIGIKKDDLTGFSSTGRNVHGRPLGAEFTRVKLQKGQWFALVSDAYVQKTYLSTLREDAGLSNEDWRRKHNDLRARTEQARVEGRSDSYTYGDDTTMALARRA